MDLSARLTELAKLKSGDAPVVSVYLNTRWSDEHQRERTRVFVKNELKWARAAVPAPAAADLAWIEAEAASLVGQAALADAHGVALFACAALGLREVVPIRAPFEDAFVVADRPWVRPLAEAAERVPATVVVFVDAESARIIPVGPGGPGEELALQSEVPGHHRRGGWALLAQSRYQRHIQVHRHQHFAAVADALAPLVGEADAVRLVLAGEGRAVAVFRRELPSSIAARVVGVISGARHEPASALVMRASELLALVEGTHEAKSLDAVLTEAAKRGRAVVGVQETLDAVARGAVHRLYVLKTFRAAGSACEHCGAMSAARLAACALCGTPVARVELGEAMVERVLQTGGTIETVADHRALAACGGVAAWLRYPL